jgi:hypothetical protein
MFVEKNNAEKKFLLEEEFNTLKQLNSSTQELITKFGQLEYQFQIIAEQKQILIDELKKVRASEVGFTQNLQNKYGSVNINIETGEITSLG